MKSRSVAILASSAMLASGAAAAPGSNLGSPPPPYFDNQTAEVFRKAVAAPNATRSIKFRPFEGSGASNVQFEKDEWTWRVNVTERTLPRLPSNVSAAGVDTPSFFATTYDLAWPTGGNISSALRGSSAPFCVTTFDYLFPPNLTGLYTDANASSADCGRVLGEDCINALYYEGNNLDADRCVRPAWADIPQCNATLGAAARVAGQNAGRPFTFSLATGDINLDSANNALVDGRAIRSGEGVWTFDSGVVDRAEAVRGYATAANRLQVFMFNTWLNITNGRVSRPNILCMRVNTSAVPINVSAAPTPGRMTALMAAALVTILALLS